MEQTPVNYEVTKEDAVHTVGTMISTEQCLVEAHMNTSKFLNIIKEANVLDNKCIDRITYNIDEGTTALNAAIEMMKELIKDEGHRA